MPVFCDALEELGDESDDNIEYRLEPNVRLDMSRLQLPSNSSIIFTQLLPPSRLAVGCAHFSIDQV